MKKRKCFLFLLLLSLGAGNVVSTAGAEKHEEKESARIASFLNGITEIFSSEPSEVRNLRAQEIIMSEEGHIEYYFKQLKEEEQRAYRQILDGVRNREEEFYLTISGAEELDRAYHAVLKDHPEIFWIHNKKDVYRTTYGDSAYCLFAPGYEYTDEEILQIQQSMEDAYQEVLWMLSENADTYEKIKTVYTYVIDQTDYVISDHDQNIAGVFYYHDGVCAGYAGAVQYLLERLGVYCIYVDGEVLDRDDGHAWNIVQIDGEYYYVDATNGDQPEFLQGDAAALAEHKTTIMDYLCPFPDEYEANFFATDEFSIPDCTSTDRNFYVMNQGCFDSYDRQSLYDYCCMRINNNAAVVRFKFSNQEAMDAACEEWISGGAVQDVAQYYMQVHNLWTVEYHYGILDDLKSIYFIF